MAEFQNRLGQIKFHERVPATGLDGFHAGLDEWMIRHGKRQAREDHITERFARHINALPKAVQTEQHGVRIVLEFLQHRGARRAGALHQCTNAEVVKHRLQFGGHIAHEFAVGEQHKRLAVGHAHKMPDPMHQSVAVFVIARIRHAAGHIEFHLLLVIKR